MEAVSYLTFTNFAAPFFKDDRYQNCREIQNMGTLD